MSKAKKSCYIAGAGFMGKTHLQGYMNSGLVDIVGIIDSDMSRATELATLAAAQPFTSLEDALAYSTVDFLDVCLPSQQHASYAIAAMEKGLDVIVEKPFSITLEDADAMLHSAKETGRRLFVAHVCRFMPQYVLAKKLVDEGAIGTLITLSCSRKSPRPAWGHNDWFLDKRLSGGTLLDLSIHDIDLANWFFGTPTGFHTKIHENSAFPGIAHVTSTINYQHGLYATVVASHLMPEAYGLESDFSLLGTEGCIEFSSRGDADHLYLYTGSKSERFSLSAFDEAGFSDPYGAELMHFVTSLISNEEFGFTPEEARLALFTVHKLYDNAEIVDL